MLFHSSAEARAAATSLMASLRSCDSAQYPMRRPVDDGRSLVVAASGPAVVWLVQHDDALGVVRIPSAGTAPPQQVTIDVAGITLAALAALRDTGS